MSVPVSVFVLLVAAMSTSQATVLELKDVSEVMRQVTQPYVVNKLRAENFTATSTDKLMVHLAVIPDKLERAHHSLMGAINGAMTQAQMAARSTIGVATGVVGISATLESLRMNCPTHRFVLDTAQLPPAGARPELSRPHHEVPDLDFGDVTQTFKGIASADHEAKAREIMSLLLKPTTGQEGMQDVILAKYGEDALVSLKDVVLAVQQVAKMVEAERMHNLRLRFEKVIQATRHVFGAYSHAAGLEAVTESLQSVVTGVDHSSGTMASLKKFTDGILQSLRAISCDRHAH